MYYSTIHSVQYITIQGGTLPCITEKCIKVQCITVKYISVQCNTVQCISV